jgi:RND family efflux transporter MFP subunit
MSGKIAAINVMLGSSVKKGDVIAKVDPSEPGTNYALSPVEAPISGSIVSSPLKIGTKVSTATAITMIGDIENLQVTASVPERYVAELKTGLKAEVYLEAYPGVVFTATVSRVSPVVDAATRTKEIILNFDKKDSRINAGMFAKVKLFISKYEGHIAIPKDAVVEQDENSYLYIVNDDNTVSKRVVKLGKSVDGIIQVVDNVMPGERVVVDGMLAISDGVKVYDISNPVKEEANADTQTTGGK